MARSRDRTPRPLSELLNALDDHQYLRREALHGLRNDRAHIKTLSAELRTLICMSSGTEGLLWRVADELKVSDVIELEGAGAANRDHPQAHGLVIWKVPLWRPGEGPPGLPKDQYRLRDVIKGSEAIYVAQIPDKVFTHELLIGAIAGQMGTAHEAEGLDYPLVQLNKLLINHTELYFNVLAFDAELTLQIVERVLDHAEKCNGFRRRPRPLDNGDVSMCVRFARNQILAGQVQIVTMRSSIGEAEITCSAGPQSAVFVLTKRGVPVVELCAPYPVGWEDNTDALFTLSYSSAHGQARTITNNKAGEAVPCGFGWLDARELYHEPQTGFEEFIIHRCTVLYKRLLSPKECGELLQMSPDGRELLVQSVAPGPFPV
jgi:hypothetical protein